jgi:hypothetical protein
MHADSLAAWMIGLLIVGSAFDANPAESVAKRKQQSFAHISPGNLAARKNNYCISS